jgi:microcystin-dependent protein
MNEAYLGQIMLFAGNFAPVGWAFCNGQLLPISQNTALYSLLGTTYGGDGKTTFALPDLRGRAPIHFGKGSNLADYQLGESGGEENVTLIASEMPAHIHAFGENCNSETAAAQASPVNGYLCATDGTLTYASNANAQMGAGTSSAAGGSQPHENRAPFLAMNYVIALQGIYPSRQ